MRHQVGLEALPALNLVRDALTLGLSMAQVEGSLVEDNVFSVSVHYRNCSEEDHPRVEAAVRTALECFNQRRLLGVESLAEAICRACRDGLEAGLDGSDECKEEAAELPPAALRLGSGKMVWELRPDVEWNKGEAVLWVLHNLEELAHVGGGAPGEQLTIYIGDDTTDEDAFRVFAAGETQGIGIVVTEDARETQAQYTLRDPQQVVQFLQVLCEHAEAAAPAAAGEA